ncbi:MAG: DEAD/DEAH box helicase [Patescibacteria group bacterium]
MSYSHTGRSGSSSSSRSSRSPNQSFSKGKRTFRPQSGFKKQRSFGGGGRGGFGGPQPKYINPARYVSEAVQPIQEEVFVPKHTFAEFGFEQQLLTNVEQHGYSTPTPIQDQAIPALMNGQDVVGVANTGTGKTAAFLLPLINKVLKNPNQGVLILAPTRELALQIADELQAFIKNLPLGFVLCIGGMSMGDQTRRLKDNPHFVIGTPGRIKDLVDRRIFRTELFTNIVLDEVDRMLDIGFRQDILYLISQLPAERHAAFFSATINRDTEEIMRRLLTDPVTISVKQRETATHVQQDVVTVQRGQNKIEVLYQLLQQVEFEKVIVFGRTKHGINKLEKALYERGVRVTSIHGNKNQNARQRSLNEFKRGRVQALLATDVAARGIDINDVTHVINYDEPSTYEDYIHRIGRTGRAGKVGKALTFVM